MSNRALLLVLMVFLGLLVVRVMPVPCDAPMPDKSGMPAPCY